MLVTLFAWMVTSIVCWAWGQASIDWLLPGELKKTLHFSVVCFTGFAVLTAFASYVSLFMEVGNLLLVVVTALALLFLIGKRSGAVLKQNFLQSLNLRFPFLLLLIVSNLLVLVMAAWHIVHPDTVEYHAAIINSVKEQGLITGYANENIRYGLQSNWFIACALFSFNFSSITTLTFANSVLLFWFLLFIAGKVAGSYQKQNHGFAFLFLLLMGISFWDYTQIRLTSTSASPDFIAALYILLAVHVFVQQKNSRAVHFFLAILFCTTAITTKLSSFPLALLLLYLLLIAKSGKTLASALLIILVTLIPFVARNYFTSGYPFFPATLFGLPAASWKLDPSEVQQVQQYITAYARTASPAEPDAVRRSLALPPHQWLPAWWNLRNVGQKVLLFGCFAALLLGAFNLNKIVQKADSRYLVSLLVTVIGLFSWFILAPDPRFGTAWLILLVALVVPLLSTKLPSWIHGKTVVITACLLSFLLCLYLVYRLLYFFDPVNLLFPYSLH